MSISQMFNNSDHISNTTTGCTHNISNIINNNISRTTSHIIRNATVHNISKYCVIMAGQ